MKYKEISRCRVCGNTELQPVLSLGEHYLTGVFPKSKEERLTSGPLELVKCKEYDKGVCGLLQLKHSYDLSELYGESYGYRSGLNRSMVAHLHGTVRGILDIAPLRPGDLVIDIGSNDSTLLQAYPKEGPVLVGIDPTGKKFKEYYPPHIRLMPDFFSVSEIKKLFGAKKARIITSIAMFYDLEDPMEFMGQVHEALADDGVWVFEQSYMPTMLEKTAYDTICHEHLEYYGLKQIKWMTDRTGFKIIAAELNDVNGGSVSITVAKEGSPHKADTRAVEGLLNEETRLALHTHKPYEDFNERIYRHRDDLRRFLREANTRGQRIFGYGASTKGNVILQFCGFTSADISLIAEINKDKFGCFTPGTLIPIVSEEEAKAMKPDYFMVLPWHFKEGIIAREKEYLDRGGKLLFPLPSIEVVKR